MQIGDYKFDRNELAGSLGDLGTIVPLAVALMIICNLSVTSVLMMVGCFYLVSGIYFKLPIPVQPLKVVSAIAIASPEIVTGNLIAASAIIFGGLLLLLAFTGFIDKIAKLFAKPVVRGIQLGLGLLLIHKGIDLVLKPGLFFNRPGIGEILVSGVSVNLLIGLAAFFIALLFISNKRFPAALVIISGGIFTGIFLGAFDQLDFQLGPTKIQFFTPDSKDFLNAFYLLVIPQMPLTIGNAVIGTTDTCRTLFGDNTKTSRATNKTFAASMGMVNVVAGWLTAMPMCHGAGGLAAHYRFGARTGGSNIIIGVIFLVIALGFGKIGIALLTAIPTAVLGILLAFAGFELSILIRDIETRNDLFIALLTGSIGFATANMGIAVAAGIIVYFVMKWRKIDF